MPLSATTSPPLPRLPHLLMTRELASKLSVAAHMCVEYPTDAEYSAKLTAAWAALDAHAQTVQLPDGEGPAKPGSDMPPVGSSEIAG